MPMKLLSDDDFRAAAKDGRQTDGTLFKFATAEAQQVGEEAARTQRFVFSDATIDHAGDSIDPKGWDLAIFKRNPVALFSHMSWDPPIGRASNVAVQGGELAGDIEFASADVYEFADTIYRLVKGKYLNAVSVGFKPKEWVFTNDAKRPYGIDFKKQTLLEISVCAVPCNPNALGEARSAGIDTAPLREWAEKVLDSGDVVFLPRQDMEALRKQAGAPERKFYIATDQTLSPTMAKAIREAVRRWQDDPREVLILDQGVTLRELTPVTRSADGDWSCGAARDLPIDEEGAWDGAAAEASIFEHAGGDDFDPAIARTGFLAYDASAPKLRGSYKLPFARVADGKLTAMASGIRAAASRLPDADVSDSVKTTARAVLDHYEAKLKDADKDLAALLTRLKIGVSADGLAEIEAYAAKAGRRVSAATKAKLQEAMDHHAAATKCLMDLMGGDDDGDPDNPDQPDAAQTDDVTLGGQPPGSVVPEPDKDLTPEQRRLKEVAALRADLPTND